MSAERLRRVAADMREKAEAATDVSGASDWHLFLRGREFAAEYGVRSSGGVVCEGTCEEEAAHIAAWSPPVALAVADWLEDAAENEVLQAPVGDLAKHWDMRVHISIQKALAVCDAWEGR